MSLRPLNQYLSRHVISPDNIFPYGAVAYLVKGPIAGRLLQCIAESSRGWEHVSVSVNIAKKKRTPTWEEMAYIKRMFWDAEDCVMQLHPPERDYVNHHEHCLHLWRPLEKEIPQPDASKQVD